MVPKEHCVAGRYCILPGLYIEVSTRGTVNTHAGFVQFYLRDALDRHEWPATNTVWLKIENLLTEPEAANLLNWPEIVKAWVALDLAELPAYARVDNVYLNKNLFPADYAPGHKTVHGEPFVDFEGSRNWGALDCQFPQSPYPDVEEDEEVS